jgi:xylose dehydrogenase (NAD/NADP)
LKVRWGILGTARINRRLVPAFQASERGELVAVASRHLTRAVEHAREHGIPHAVEGYDTLLNDSSIDAVYIPLPNTDHVAWTLRAIAAGKHVLCEKPIALDPLDVDRIADAAAAANVMVEEGFMYRHEPMTAKVLALINDGAIGSPRAVVSGFTFLLEGDANIRFNPSLGGGALWDIGCYPVTYAQLIAGQEPKVASGLAHWTATGVDDEFMGMLRFDSGLTANIYASFRAAQRTWLEVLGTGGARTVPNPFRPGPLEHLELERSGQVERIPVEGSPLIFVRQIEDFEARILDGAPAVVSLEESRRAVATIAALYQSAAASTAPRRHGATE